METPLAHWHISASDRIVLAVKPDNVDNLSAAHGKDLPSKSRTAPHFRRRRTTHPQTGKNSIAADDDLGHLCLHARLNSTLIPREDLVTVLTGGSPRVGCAPLHVGSKKLGECRHVGRLQSLSQPLCDRLHSVQLFRHGNLRDRRWMVHDASRSSQSPASRGPTTVRQPPRTPCWDFLRPGNAPRTDDYRWRSPSEQVTDFFDQAKE